MVAVSETPIGTLDTRRQMRVIRTRQAFGVRRGAVRRDNTRRVLLVGTIDRRLCPRSQTRSTKELLAVAVCRHRCAQW
jgi:hypothetical protein